MLAGLLAIVLFSADPTLKFDRTVEVKVGSTPLVIPVPEGYVEVTPEMKLIHKSISMMNSPSQELLAAFIPAESKEKALANQPIDEPTLLRVNSNSQLTNVTLTRSMLEEVKKQFTKLNTQSGRAKLEAEKNQQFKNELGKNAAPQININAMTIYDSTPDSFCFKTTSTYSNGLVEYGTGSFLIPKGKMLNIYWNTLDGTESDCAAKLSAWTAETLERNPSNWFSTTVLNTSGAVYGAIIGGIIGLGIALYRKFVAS